MNTSRNKLRIHRKRRIRAKISGTSEKPRLCVFRSLTRIEAQVIDDQKGTTFIQVDTKKMKVNNDVKGAEALGKEIAKQCLSKKISAVVFDRGGYRYHGKIKALADGAREGGLKF